MQRDEDKQPMIPQENGQNVQQEIQVKIKTNLDGCDDEQDFFCTNCKAVKRSKVAYHYGVWTWLCCGIWCFLTIVGGIVPFLWNKCQDKQHLCSNCSVPAGTKEFKPCC